MIFTALIFFGISFFVGLIISLNRLIRYLDKKTLRKSKQDNPYISAHRIKMTNDKMYQEYLEWLDKAGGDIPFEKWKFEEELKAETNIYKNLN